MNDLQIFNNPEFGNIRAIDIDGEGWFVGNDVAKALGYANPYNAVERHVDIEDTLKQGVVDSNGKTQQTKVINESGVYALIILSDLPSAKKFKRWVTKEVLPSIRKTGSYSMQELPKTQAQLLLAQSELLVQMETKLTAVEEKADNIEKRLDSAIHIFSTSSEEMWAGDMNMQIKEIVKEHKLSEPKFKGKLYKELEQVASVRINSRLSRFRKRMLKQGSTYAQTMTVTKLDIIEQDIQLREIFQGIVRKHQAVFCVGGVEPDNTFQRQEPSDERG